MNAPAIRVDLKTAYAIVNRRFSGSDLAGVFEPECLEALRVLRDGDRPGFDARCSQLNRDQRAVLFKRIEQTRAPEPVVTALPPTRRGSDLMRREFSPIRWLIPGLMPEGLMLLAARPKIGKSWFALDMSLACATGGRIFDRPVERGRVLHLALEDSDRRMHSRMTKLGAIDPARLDLFEYATEWPRGTEGAAAIAAWIRAHEDARLVIVDVFTKLREVVTGGETLYAMDYQDVAMLKPPPDRAVTILLVMHTRKQDSDDPLDTVSGTLGIGGAADGALILKRARGESEAELHLIGRDLEDEGQFAVRFDRDTCRWQWMGDAWRVRISQERREILDALADGALKPNEIAKAIGKESGAVRKLLHGMAADGQVDRGMDGKYRAIEVPT